MSNEAQIRTSLQISGQGSVAPLKFQNQNTSFYEDMSSPQAASPGNVLVTVGGVVIDISKVGINPGLAVFSHLGSDPLNYVEIGIYNGVDFYPFMELMAGKEYVLKLARNLLQQYAGSGTLATSLVSLYAKASLGAVNINALVFPL